MDIIGFKFVPRARTLRVHMHGQLAHGHVLCVCVLAWLLPWLLLILHDPYVVHALSFTLLASVTHSFDWFCNPAARSLQLYVLQVCSPVLCQRRRLVRCQVEDLQRYASQQGWQSSHSFLFDQLQKCKAGEGFLAPFFG